MARDKMLPFHFVNSMELKKTTTQKQTKKLNVISMEYYDSKNLTI